MNAIKVIFIHQWGYKGIGMNSLFSKETQQKMSQRLQSIFSEISAEKVSLNVLAELCELQDWEERYWTIIWDNLASSFLYAREFTCFLEKSNSSRVEHSSTQFLCHGLSVSPSLLIHIKLFVYPSLFSADITLLAAHSIEWFQLKNHF
ncbi:unnamed protein product [Haemonchus placei]|uniref:Uncharacterized protein n=1 Tax=Haemonchus placei TaxID=6290 RepID=A0A3P7XUD5_HAEPC|nr:unnamed protein product [Haemonchus placei]